MTKTSNPGQSAKEHAAEVGAQMKATATQEAVARADQVKDTAAERVQNAANATDAAAREFDAASPQAQAMQQVADHIEGAAAKLRNADVRELAEQATSIARRNPLLFIGGAAIAGFAAARFLKARDPNPRPFPADSDPWATTNHTPRAGFSGATASTAPDRDVNGGWTNA